MIILVIFLLLHILLLLPPLLCFWCRLEGSGKPRNKLNDIFNSRFASVDDHGILQVMNKFLMEHRLILQLKDEMSKVIKMVLSINGKLGFY